MSDAKAATPRRILIEELMDSRIPKTEREHAAAREIERLRQAVLDEREACARLCDGFEMAGYALWDRTADPDAQGRATAAADCAAAIRARGDSE